MLDAIAARRSIRKFKSTEVPRNIIEEVLRAGTLAPSSKNRQPWQFVVTTGVAKAEALAAMERGLQREAQQPLLPESAQYIAGAHNTLAIMRQAPVVIFVVNPLGLDLLTPQNATACLKFATPNRSALLWKICRWRRWSMGLAVCGFAIFTLLTASCANGLTAAVNCLPPLLWATPMKHQHPARVNRGATPLSGVNKKQRTIGF